MLKRWMLWTGATVAVALPVAGQASDGRIDFVGAVTTPTCTLVVSGVGTSPIVSGISRQRSATLSLAATAGTFFSMGDADCLGVADTSKMGAATLVSIYFEIVNSVEHESGAIISIVYK